MKRKFKILEKKYPRLAEAIYDQLPLHPLPFIEEDKNEFFDE